MAAGDGGAIRIRIDFDVDDASLARVRKQISALSREGDKFDAALNKNSQSMGLVDVNGNKLSSTLDELQEKTDKLTDGNDRLGRSFSRTTRNFRRSRMQMMLLLVTIAYVTLEWWAMVAALSSVNGLIASGQAIMKTYQWVMKGVAYSVGAVTVALGVAASAQREYNASMQAFRYKSAPALSTGTSQAMAALRGLTADSDLAVFGMQALSATFAAVSKNAELTGNVQSSLRGLADFAISAGGDIGQNLTAIGAFLGELRKAGSVTDEVAASAGQVSEEFGKAVENAKKLGITGADELMAMFASGEFARIAGIEGALSNVNQTLFGTLKAYFTQLQVEFADFGQFFLDDAKDALDELVSNFRVAFTRITGVVAQEFGGGKLFGDVVNVLSRFMDFTANVTEKYLPQTGNMWSWLKTTVTTTLKFFNDLGKSLERYSEASTVINESFGPVFRTIGRGFVDSFRSLAATVVENRDNFMAFGNALSNTFETLRSGIELVKNAWMAAMPYLTGVLNAISSILGPILDGLNSFFTFMGGTTSGSLSGASQAVNRSGAGDILGGVGGVGGIAGVAMLTALIRERRNPDKPPGMFGRFGGGLLNQYRSVKEYRRLQTLPNPPAGAAAGGPKRPSLGSAATLAAFAMPLLADQEGNAAPFQMVGGLTSLFAPSLGLGISGTGTAITSDNALKGLLAGGAGGAAIGSMIAPVIGTAIGAGLGAVVGGTSGFIRQMDIGAPGSNDAWWKDTVAMLNPTIALWADAERRNVAIAEAQANMAEEARGVMELAMTEGVDAARQRVEEISRETDRLTELEREFSGKSQKERQQMADELLQAGEITRELASALSQRHMGTFADETRKMSDGLEEAADVGLAEFERKLEVLSATTGKSENELIALANTMGVNLFDGTQTLAEALEDLGLSTVKTADEIRAATRQIYASAYEELFLAPIQRAETENIINEIGENVRQLGTSATKLQLDQAIYDLSQAALVLHDGDALRAAQWLAQTVGPGGLGFREGAPFEGLEGVVQQYGIGDRALEGLAVTASGQLRGEVTNAFTAALSGSGIATTQNDVNRLVDTLTVFAATPASEGMQVALDEVRRYLANVAERGGVTDAQGQIVVGEAAATIVQDAIRNAIMGNADLMSPEEIRTVLDTYKIDLDFAATATADEKANEAIQALSEAGQKIIDSFAEQVAKTIDDNPQWWVQAPDWYNNPTGILEAVRSGINTSNIALRATIIRSGDSDDGTDGGDTTATGNGGDTTSSRLARTLGKHSRLNAMLPGNRYVTSSWRNWNLGSLNSDHLTGNAYDLQGQNLVGYSALVNRMGGFSEFHGSGSDRHLHVVPGNMPIGDAMTPAPTPVIAMGGSSGSTYNIQIYSQPGQDANAIANAVMARIDQRDRDKMERS